VVERGAALARETGVHVWDVPLHLQGVNAALADDDLGRARVALRAAEALLDRDNLLALSIFEHERGLVALRAGQRDEAVESAHSVLRLGARGGMPFHEALGEIMLALTFVAAGESGAARPHLEAARRVGIAMRSEYVAVVCDLCDAELSRREGDLPAARERLACGLRTSREKHIAPDVWFSRKQLGDLCTVALDAEIEVAHVRGWVERLRLEPTSLAHTLEDWPWRVRIRVLGKLEVIVGSEPSAHGQRGRWRPLDVIAALVASGHAEAPEHAIAEVLWPESEGDRSQHALETAVYRLRRLLGAGVVVHRNRTVGIDTRTTWVDALSLHTLLEQGDACLARGDLDAALSLAERTVGLYRGPFLAGREDPWVLAARRRVRMKVERAVSDLVRRGASRARVCALQTRIASVEPESEFDARGAEQ
jgi:DNA-binding SARP family transcriptional activator